MPDVPPPPPPTADMGLAPLETPPDVPPPPPPGTDSVTEIELKQPPPRSTSDEFKEPEPLNPITARPFNVTVLKRSQSYRVYLVDDPTGAEPKEGKILLFKRGANPMMGLRVLKTYYPERKQFAAKRIQIYDHRRVLDIQENYLALEKTGDLAFPAPDAQDRTDLKELEAGLPPPPPSDGSVPPVADMGLPPPPPPPGEEGGLPPPPPPADGSLENPEAMPESADALELESHNAIVVEEPKVLDPHHQWLSATVGALANYDANGGLTYFMGAGARYGITIAKSLFIQTPRVQDSIALEAGAFLYRISAYASADGSDSYTILPAVGTLRYNIQISDSFGLFFYGGVMKNFIIQAANADDIGLTYLGNLGLAAGGGAYLQLGPGWHIRADAGYDTFAMSLMLRF